MVWMSAASRYCQLYRSAGLSTRDWIQRTMTAPRGPSVLARGGVVVVGDHCVDGAQPVAVGDLDAVGVEVGEQVGVVGAVLVDDSERPVRKDHVGVSWCVSVGVAQRGQLVSAVLSAVASAASRVSS